LLVCERRRMSDLAIGIGHLLLGGLFVWAGIDHFLRFREVEAMLVGRGWPRAGALLAAASAFQILAGLGLAVGVLRPWAALGLAAFTVAASLLLLDFWRFQGEQRGAMRSGFAVNVGLVGGLILAFGASI
jgi:putative oxidoreductase